WTTDRRSHNVPARCPRLPLRPPVPASAPSALLDPPLVLNGRSLVASASCCFLFAQSSMSSENVLAVEGHRVGHARVNAELTEQGRKLPAMMRLVVEKVDRKSVV